MSGWQPNFPFRKSFSVAFFTGLSTSGSLNSNTALRFCFQSLPEIASRASPSVLIAITLSTIPSLSVSIRQPSVSGAVLVSTVAADSGTVKTKPKAKRAEKILSMVHSPYCMVVGCQYLNWARSSVILVNMFHWEEPT